MIEVSRDHLNNTGFENAIGPANVRTVFVTGGTGLVGSHLLEHLVDAGMKVKALYRTKVPDIAGKEKIEWIKGDILDIICLEELMENVELVYHCAAIVSFNPKEKQQMFLTNVEGTANVVNAALKAGITKLCYVSSVAALGILHGRKIDESMNWSEETGEGNYAKSKYLAELEVWRAIGEGLKAVVVNPVIILGAGNWNDSSTKIFKSAYEEFPWYTEGVNGFVDVNDVVRAMLQLMESNISAERFVLSGEDCKYKDVFTMIAKAFNKKAPYKKVNRFIAAIVWRLEVLKAMLAGQQPLLTRETANTAQAVVSFDNSKIRRFLPLFSFTPISETISRTCKELQVKLHL